MEDYSCDICFQDFDETEIIPKVLVCGHSFCCSCISGLREHGKRCPKCNTKMTKKPINQYPTNYSLLSVVSSIQTMRLQESYSETLEVLIKEMRQMKDSLEIDIEEKKSYLSKVNEILERIQHITNGSLPVKDFEEMFNQMKNNLNNNHASNAMKASVTSDDFNDYGYFIKQIYEEVCKGASWYVMANVGGVVRYGKITSWNRMLLINSLSVTSINGNVNTVLLSDIKKGMRRQSFRVFLKVPLDAKGATHTMLIKMRESMLARRFMKYCTGENGPSYRNVAFERGHSPLGTQSILTVNSEAVEEDEDATDYDIALGESKGLDEQCIVVQRLDGGGFHILRNMEPSREMRDVVGLVVSSQVLISRLYFGGDKLVLECGLAFYI